MKTIYCDAHIHLSQSKSPDFSEDEAYFCISSCHSQEEIDFLGRLREENGNSISEQSPNLYASFGIHPQIVTKKYLEEDFNSDLNLLESLLKAKKIIATGEFGFDFFTQEFKATKEEQKIVFEKQLVLAQNYAVPVILHLRKSIEKIFTYSKELKKVPSVIFHSFPGTLREANSILNHGVNAYFSFGKPILNGKKSAIDCVKNLPIKNILLETDAPYQPLKNESETFPEDIKKVYEKASDLRNIPLPELREAIFENFKTAIAKC